jgi:flagellar basal body-associated protein FliL
MSLTRDRRSQLLLYVYRGLLGFLILLGLVFILGTIYGVFFNKNLPSQEKPTVSQKVGEGQIFTGIGTIRVPTADTQPAMVILFISFIYYPEDKAFSEELALRVKDFKQIIVDYFSSFPVLELRRLDEEIIKTELLLRFNSILRLGKIETMYLGDYIIIG